MDESGRKIRKIWVDQGSKFYNRSMKSWFHGNDIGMYLTLKEGKCFVAEGFIRTLKSKIYKNITAVLNVYIERPDEVVDKYNKTYHGQKIEGC